MQKGFSDFNALKIRCEEGTWPFHLFHDEVKCENVEVLVVVIISLEDIVLHHDRSEL